MAQRLSMDYAALLARAKKDLPDVAKSDIRWSLPEPDVMTEGRTTVLRNIEAILSAVRREESHLVTYLLREIGTAGGKEGDRLIFQGNIPTKQIQEKLNAYVNTYVMCPECHRPDTHLEKDERTVILKCEACGARKPVTVRKARPVEEKKETLKEGKVLELDILDISQRGDGVAKVDRFTVFVPGTRKGARVRVLIEKISGNVAFAKIQP